MPKLNKADLLGATVSDAPTRDVKLLMLDGMITVRGLRSITQWNDVLDVVQKGMLAAEKGVPPFAGLTRRHINAAAYLAAGYVPAPGEEPMTFPEALQILPKLGPQAVLIGNLIGDLSGLDESLLKAEEQSLESDPFPDGDLDDRDGVPPPAAE